MIPRHSHVCYRWEIIVEGSMIVDGDVLQAGDVMFSEPNVIYGPHTVGPEGCTTAEGFDTMKGASHIVMDMPEGPTVFEVSTPEGREAQMAARERQRQIFQDSNA
jgi:hypothetical protein